MDEIVQEALEKKKIIIASDLNGHVGKERQCNERVNGGWRFRERNETGDEILEFLERVLQIRFSKKGMRTLQCTKVKEIKHKLITC